MKALLEEVAACRACAALLPLGPRPVLRASPTARLLIIGQAPGTRVHATGIPWNDPSGERLRAWLGMDRSRFYDASRIAIMPMGFCYPGRLPSGGDAPPRPECRVMWHPRLLAAMPLIRLTLLVGAHALAHYLDARASMTDLVRRQPGLPRFFALPHPSWRNNAWMKRHPWFMDTTLPLLRRCVAEALSEPDR